MTSSWTHGILRATSPASACEIIKLGGSLLGMAGWPGLVSELVRDRATVRPVLLVVGGGAIVDGLRVIDAAAPQPAALTHALAIDLMRTTARLVADALAVPVVVERDTEPVAVLDASGWLAAGCRSGLLPVGWHVTSDTIAAEVAAEIGCDLLLAKRAAPPPCPGHDAIDAVARAGWVDGHFATAAAGIGRIAWAAPTSVPMPGVGRTTLDRSDASRR